MSRQAVPLRIWHLSSKKWPKETWELAIVDFSIVRYACRMPDVDAKDTKDPATEATLPEMQSVVTLQLDPSGMFIVPPEIMFWTTLVKDALQAFAPGGVVRSLDSLQQTIGHIYERAHFSKDAVKLLTHDIEWIR